MILIGLLLGFVAVMAVAIVISLGAWMFFIAVILFGLWMMA